MAQTERQRLERRLAELRDERATFEKDWRDITAQMAPNRARWDRGKHNRSTPKDTKLINSTPQRALRILAAGLMAGITSPSRIWFHLNTSDSELNEKHSVRSYLDEVERIIREVLAKSRFYQTLASGIYRDLGSVGTAGAFMDADDVTGLRFESFTIGEYFLAANVNGIVDTAYIERPMTVRQIVQKFGLDNVSPQLQNSFKQGNLKGTHDVIHAVYPNADIVPGRLGPDGMEFASRWWEKNSPKGFLREGGYNEFPGLFPRWNTQAGETYGRSSPGWESLGDCKALQHLEIRSAQLVDKLTKPPMKASSAMRSERASLLPGDMTYMPPGQGHVFEPAFKIDPAALEAVRNDKTDHELRINQNFYVDLWMSMLSDTRAQRATATEVEAKRTEVMLQLGPLLENLNNELLEPAITRTFAVLQRQGRFPEPPPELENSTGAVKIEFISIMHQAQKMTGIVGVRELIIQTLTMAEARPDAVDKLNVDAIMDELADMLGIKPDLILSADEVAEIREAKAAQAQAQAQGEAMLAATEGAKNLKDVDPQQIQDVAATLSPAAAAQGGLL